MTDQAPTTSQAPVEHVQFTIREGLLRFAWGAPLLTTILVGMLACFGIMFVFSLVMARGVPGGNAIQFMQKLGIMFCIAWCVVAGLTAPVVLLMALTGRTRKYWAEGNRLFSQVGKKVVELELQDSKFQFQGDVAWDSRGSYRGPHRPRLLVFNDRKQQIAVGFTEDSALQWANYFDDLGVQKLQRFNWLKLAVVSFISALLGSVIGLLIEQLLPKIGGPAVLPGSVAFVGATNGLLIGSYYVASRYNSEAIKHPALGAFFLAMPCSGLAMKWCGVWEVAVGSGILGAIAGWALFPRTHFFQEENARIENQ